MDVMKLIGLAAVEKTRKALDTTAIISLGELIASLKAVDPGYICRIRLPEGMRERDYGYPFGFVSYRGYYEQLALTTRDEKDPLVPTVGEVLALAENALGATFTGYKGGNYRMGRTTPVWSSEHDTASGRAIIGVYVDERYAYAMIETAYIQDELDKELYS